MVEWAVWYLVAGVLVAGLGCRVLRKRQPMSVVMLMVAAWPAVAGAFAVGLIYAAVTLIAEGLE